MRNRHRKQNSVEPCRQQAIVRGLFEDLRGYNFSCIAAQIKIRSTLLPTERLVAASEERTSYIAYKAIHEQEERATVAPVCRAFWYFCATKVHDNKTTNRIQDNSVYSQNT